MKKLIILLIIPLLTGCIKNEDFKQTCTYEKTSQNITDKTKMQITYNYEDEVLNAIVTKTYKSKNEDGLKTINQIKKSSINYNKKYINTSSIKITVPKETEDEYQLRYYIDVPNSEESILNEFNLKTNSIKLFEKLKKLNYKCK